MKKTKFLTEWQLTPKGEDMLQRGTPLRLPGNLTRQGALIDAPIQIKNLEQLTDYNAKRLFERKDGLGKAYVQPVSQKRISGTAPTTSLKPKS